MVRYGEFVGSIAFATLIETSSLVRDAQARVLGISEPSLRKAWKFFGYRRKLHEVTTRFLRSGEHGFDEKIMEQLGFNEEDHVSVLAWYVLLDDKTRKEVNNDAAGQKRKYEKEKQEYVKNEQGQKMTKVQLRSQLKWEKMKQENVENEQGQKMTKAQFKYEKTKQEYVENDEGEMVTKAQRKYEKTKQQNKQIYRDQLIQGPPARMDAEKCSTCGSEKCSGWVTAPDAIGYVIALFKENKLETYPSFEATNGYLTIKKRKYLSNEDILLRTTDILCKCCWVTCKGKAEAKIKQLLQSQKKEQVKNNDTSK